MHRHGNLESLVRIPWRPQVVGTGSGRQACFRVAAAGFDAVLSATVTYGIAEGFSRGSGQPPGNPMRFHEGDRRHVGLDLPPGLTADALFDIAKATIEEPGLFEGRTIEDIEGICVQIGIAMHADCLRGPAW